MALTKREEIRQNFVELVFSPEFFRVNNLDVFLLQLVSINVRCRENRKIVRLVLFVELKGEQTTPKCIVDEKKVVESSIQRKLGGRSLMFLTAICGPVVFSLSALFHLESVFSFVSHRLRLEETVFTENTDRSCFLFVDDFDWRRKRITFLDDSLQLMFLLYEQNDAKENRPPLSSLFSRLIFSLFSRRDS